MIGYPASSPARDSIPIQLLFNRDSFLPCIGEKKKKNAHNQPISTHYISKMEAQ